MEMDTVHEYPFEEIDVTTGSELDSDEYSESDKEPTTEELKAMLPPDEWDETDYSPIQIVTRQAWGAREPHYQRPMIHPIQHTLFSYANIKPCTSRRECMQAMRDLQNKNMDKDELADIQYNFYMAPDLTLYEGRGYHVASEETYKYYKKMDGEKLDICYLGHVKDLKGESIFPSHKAESVREVLLDYGVKQGYLDEDVNALCLHQ